MTDISSWPDPNIDWEYPADSRANAETWQAALDAGLVSKRLTLAQVGYKLYELIGPCPRCAHELSAPVELDVIRGADEASQKTAMANVDCTCNDLTHKGAPKDRPGCGWGGPLAVTIVVK